MLRVRVLGDLALELDGRRLALPDGRPARALLAWLALHPGTHPRAAVAAALWPDVLDSSARASLRTALSAVRRSLGEQASEVILAGREQVGLAGAPTVTVDALELEALLDAGQPAQALELALGELASELDDDWVLRERDRLRERCSAALAALSTEAAARGDADEAVAFARRRTDLDPLDEPAHRDLMRALADSGEPAAALAVYNRLSARLRRELAVVPSASTRELAASLRAGASPPTDGARPALPSRLRPDRWRSPFIGRDEALAQLGAAWAVVRRGGLAIAVIAGEPGIGKSRLAGHFGAQEAAAGAVVLAGRAEPEPLQPYELLVDALGAGVPADRTAAAEPSDSHAGLVRRHEELAALLEETAHGHPMVLVLDDLHWADAASLDFLRHLALRGTAMPLLVVATLRAGTLSVLAPFERELELTRIELGGLSLHETAALVAGRTDEAVAEADLERLASRTGGNPFFLEILLDSGLAGGDALPADVAEVLAGRLASLGGAARRVLQAGALLGSDFDPELAAAVADLAIEEAFAALDSAEASRLVLPSVGEGGRVRFAHALVREALMGATRTGEQRRLHARALAALEGRVAGSDEALVAAARHALAAVPVVPAARAAELAERAGAALLAGYAPSEAAELLESAAAMLDERGEPATLRVSIRCLLSEALQAAGRGRDARAAVEHVALLARRGDGTLLARWALALAGPPVTILGADPDRVDALEDALEQLPRDESALRSRLQGRLAVELAYESDARRREELSAAAVAAARVTGQPRTIAAALGARHVVLWGPDHARERLALADEMLGFARRDGDAALELQARTWRIVDIEELGDGDALESELDAYAAAAARSGLTAYGWYVPGWRAARAYLAGRIAEGHRLRRRAVELGRRAGDGNVQFALRSNWVVDLADGRPLGDTALEWQRERIRVSPASWAYRSMYVWMLTVRGFEDAARSELAVQRRDGAPGVWPRDTNWLSAVAELSEAAVLLGERELGAELSALLEPFDDRMVVAARGFMCFGSVAGTLGRLADLSGDAALAVRRYEQAIDLEERAGALVWASAHRFRLAAALAVAGDPRARAELDRVQEEAPRRGLDTLATVAGAMAVPW
jgi:DNA-binding SARP family transcriptional activator